MAVLAHREQRDVEALGQQRGVAIRLGVAVGLLAAHALDACGRHAGQQRLHREAIAGALVIGWDAPLVAEVERDLRPVEAVAPGLGRQQVVGRAGRRAARQHEAARGSFGDQLAEPLDRPLGVRGDVEIHVASCATAASKPSSRS